MQYPILTRLVCGLLPKRIPLLRQTLHRSIQESAVISPRRIYMFKSVLNYPKNTNAVPFCTSVETRDPTDRSKDKSDEADIHYVEVSGLPFISDENDIKGFFGDVVIVGEPQLLKLEHTLGNHCGNAMLKVAGVQNAKLCLAKNGSNFLGRRLDIRIHSEVNANAVIGETVLKIKNIPFSWKTTELHDFLVQMGVDDIYEIIIPPSAYKNASSGRAYVAFFNREAKEKAAITLDNLEYPKADDKTLTFEVEDSSFLQAYFDRSQERKKAINERKNQVKWR